MKSIIERLYSVFYQDVDNANSNDGEKVLFSTKAVLFYSTIALSLLFLFLIVQDIAENLNSV